MAVTAASLPGTRSKLNSNQIKGFWAAWGGWCLDGMDAFIYSLVLVPALTELLPKSGIDRRRPATSATTAASCSRCSSPGGACRWCGDRSRIASDA